MSPDIIFVEGNEIKLDNEGKLLFPDDGVTKKDLASYYENIAPLMLPYVKDRPLTMNRFPNGIKGEGFFQKEAPSYFPSYIRRSAEKKEGGTTTYPVCNNAASLVYLAGQACITMHVWLSRDDRPEYPDMMIFDLDPPDNDFEHVRHAAFAIRELLEKLNVSVFVKTTGSRGLHVVVPLDRSASYDIVRPFARSLAVLLAGRDPAHLTVEERKEKRGSRIFLDTLRNSYAQTAVAPYSVRAIPGAPVAAPLEWEELKNPEINSRSYNISNLSERMKKTGDPWRNLWQKTYSIAEMQKRLEALK